MTAEAQRTRVLLVEEDEEEAVVELRGDDGSGATGHPPDIRDGRDLSGHTRRHSPGPNAVLRSRAVVSHSRSSPRARRRISTLLLRRRTDRAVPGISHRDRRLGYMQRHDLHQRRRVDIRKWTANRLVGTAQER